VEKKLRGKVSIRFASLQVSIKSSNPSLLRKLFGDQHAISGCLLGTMGTTVMRVEDAKIWMKKNSGFTMWQPFVALCTGHRILRTHEVAF